MLQKVTKDTKIKQENNNQGITTTKTQNPTEHIENTI